MVQKVNPIQLQKYLKGVNYPAHKKDLVAKAKSHGADANILQTLEELPDKKYDGPTGIAKEVGKIK
jgi:hypothetical protein